MAPRTARPRCRPRKRPIVRQRSAPWLRPNTARWAGMKRAQTKSPSVLTAASRRDPTTAATGPDTIEENTPMSPGDLVLRTTAWLSLIAWTAAEWLRPGDPRRDGRPARWAFTAGAVALLVHIGTAFQVRHGWSHAAAMQHVEKTTLEVTGISVGAGIFVNYLFLALWTLEAAWWWLAPAGYRSRAAALDWTVRGFFLFMFVNGGIVFVPGPLRWLGVAAVLVVLLAWYRARGQGS